MCLRQILGGYNNVQIKSGISYESLARLREQECLNDEIVNAYLTLNGKFLTDKLHVFNSYFYT